jgi:hypothetical protein
MVMAQSNAERQRKHRRKLKGSVVRMSLEIPVEVAAKLGYLAHHWGCTRREAFSRLLLETWWREGRPIPGYDDEGDPLPGNEDQ